MLKIKYSKYSREITSAPPPKLLQASATSSWWFAVEASDVSPESQGKAADNCPDWALFYHFGGRTVRISWLPRYQEILTAQLPGLKASLKSFLCSKNEAMRTRPPQTAPA